MSNIASDFRKTNSLKDASVVMSVFFLPTTILSSVMLGLFGFSSSKKVISVEITRDAKCVYLKFRAFTLSVFKRRNTHFLYTRICPRGTFEKLDRGAELWFDLTLTFASAFLQLGNFLFC